MAIVIEDWQKNEYCENCYKIHCCSKECGSFRRHKLKNELKKEFAKEILKSIKKQKETEEQKDE